MRHLLQLALWGVGITLQVVLLTSLVRYFQKRYLALLFYTVSLFLTTVAELALQENGRIPADYLGLYWSLELIRHAFLYNVVLTLVYQAIQSDSGRRVRVVALLAACSASYWAACLWFLHEERFNLWMTHSVQWISLGSAVLNLVVWATLVSKRHRNRVLLMISGAYGMQSAGEAIGQSLRMLSVSSRSMGLFITGNLVAVLAHFLCLYVWWRTVVRSARELAPSAIPAPDFDPNRPQE